MLVKLEAEMNRITNANTEASTLDRVYAAHNADTACSCSTCNIIRMCDLMAALTENTNRLLRITTR